MEDKEMLNLIIQILNKEKIEILNIANTEVNDILLAFLIKGHRCYITIEGLLVLDESMEKEDIAYVKKIIAYAQRKIGIDNELPIKGLEDEDLQLEQIGKLSYRLLIKIKNQCLFFRDCGVFGIQYVLCKQIQQEGYFIYKDVALYHKIEIAQQHFFRRANLTIKPFELFSNEELKTILFYIEAYKKDKEVSKNLSDITTEITSKVVGVLKGDK